MSAFTWPVVFPPVRAWTAGEGSFSWLPSGRIACPSELGPQALVLAKSLTSASLPERQLVPDGEATPGDVVLCLDDDVTGYRIEIGDRVVIAAPTPRGVSEGGQTLRQLLAGGGPLPGGVLDDAPAFASRGLMIDTVPRAYARDWWSRLTERLAALKYTELAVICNGVGLGGDAVWLDERCSARGIDLTPIVPVISHCDSLLRRYPEFGVDPGADSALIRGAFDFTREGALDLARAECEKAFAPFTSPYWHVGGDEYLAFPAHERPWDRYPRFAEFARRVTGNPDATAADAFTWYVNWLAALARERGKVLKVWNDHLERGVLRLDEDIVVEHWYQPSTPLGLTPPQIADHNLVLNCCEEELYHDMGWRRLSARRIVEHFDPTAFQGGFTVAAERVLGARLHVWMPESPQAGGRMETSDEMAEAIAEPLEALAYVLWTGRTTGQADFVAAKVPLMEVLR